MDGTRDSHIKRSQKKPNTIWYHLYVESKIWHKWSIYKTGTWRADLFARGEVGERGTDRDFGVGRYRPLHLEKMGNGVLLYSTGNCVQSLGLEHDGKWKKRMCVYGWLGVTLLYSRNWKNIIKQLHFNKKFKKEKRKPGPSFVDDTGFLAGYPAIPFTKAPGTVKAGLWITPGWPERHLNPQQVLIWKVMACSPDLLYKFCTVGSLCLGCSPALSAEMNPGLLILLPFKGIPGVLRQATEKAVLFQDFWIVDVSGLVMPLKLQMSLVPEVTFYIHQKRWQGMQGFMVVSPGKETSWKIGPTCPAISLYTELPPINPLLTPWADLSWQLPN